MNNRISYLRWLSMLCCVLAIFGICIFVVGYKEVSIGRVATIVLLFIGAGVCQYFLHKYKKSDPSTDQGAHDQDSDTSTEQDA